MDSEENKNEESQSDPPPSNSNPPQPESISNSNPVDDSDSSIPMNEILLNLVLSSFENNIFLSENTLSSLENILYPKITPLDDFCLNDPEIDSKLSIIIKERSLAIVDFLKDKMQFCHSKIIDGEFSHLEKLMKILRSSKREMRLTRLKEHENSQLNFQKNLPQSNLESIFAKIRHCAHNKTIDRKRSQSLILENDYEINERSKSCDKFNNEEPSWCMHVLIKNKRREKMECLTKELLSINDLQELITFNIFKKNLIKENSPSDNSFSFRLNNRYLVTLKNCEERTTDKTSYFRNIPCIILEKNILPFFTAMELFNIRSVNNEWRESIRSMWHFTFQREMHEQLYATDLCSEIESYFKSVSLKTPFFHKFGIFLKALTEILSDDWINTILSQNEVDLRIQKIFYSILTIVGIEFNKKIENLHQFNNDVWNEIKLILSNKPFKSIMDSVLDGEYVFYSNNKLMSLKKDFVSCYSISIENLNDLNDKNAIILSLYLKQLYFFGLLKNSIFIGQKFLIAAKDKLKQLSESWSQKKGFLEGAYKILLFKNSKIINGQISIEEENIIGEEANETEDNFSFASLLSDFKDPNKADFVIKKKGSETRIYLDETTKTELLINSMLISFHGITNKQECLEIEENKS